MPAPMTGLAAISFSAAPPRSSGGAPLRARRRQLARLPVLPLMQAFYAASLSMRMAVLTLVNAFHHALTLREAVLALVHAAGALTLRISVLALVEPLCPCCRRRCRCRGSAGRSRSHPHGRKRSSSGQCPYRSPHSATDQPAGNASQEGPDHASDDAVFCTRSHFSQPFLRPICGWPNPAGIPAVPDALPPSVLDPPTQDITSAPRTPPPTAASLLPPVTSQPVAAPKKAPVTVPVSAPLVPLVISRAYAYTAWICKLPPTRRQLRNPRRATDSSLHTEEARLGHVSGALTVYRYRVVWAEVTALEGFPVSDLRFAALL
jgi:hypothetical protein